MSILPPSGYPHQENMLNPARLVYPFTFALKNPSIPALGKTPIVDLPREIQDQIFAYIRLDLFSGAKELKVLALTRKLNACAERALYRFISIDICDRCETLQNVVAKLSNQPDLTKHTEYISLTTKFTSSDTRLHKNREWDLLVAKILTSSPNLKHLVLQVGPFMPETKKALAILSKVVQLELRATRSVLFDVGLLPRSLKRLSIDGFQIYKAPEFGTAFEPPSPLSHFDGLKSRLNDIAELHLSNLQWSDDDFWAPPAFRACVADHAKVLQRFNNLRKLSMTFSPRLGTGHHSLFQHGTTVLAKYLPSLTELEFRGQSNTTIYAPGIPAAISDKFNNLRRLSIAARAVGMDAPNPLLALPSTIQDLDIWLYHFSAKLLGEVLYNLCRVRNHTPQVAGNGKYSPCNISPYP